MINELLLKCKYILVETVNQLKGSSKRKALAKTAKELRKGGQSIVAYEFKVSRDIIRKGMHELESSGIAFMLSINNLQYSKISSSTPVVTLVGNSSLIYGFTPCNVLRKFFARSNNSSCADF